MYFHVPYILRHGRGLCKARSREWRSTSSEGPEKAQRFATHPSANRRATHRGPAGASELGHARQVSAADSTDCLVAPATSHSSRRAVRFTRGKAASRATRPGKPSRILQELTVGSYGNITKMPRCWRSRGLRATPPRTLSSNSSGQMIKIMARAHCG